jgi:putative peptidoglycan lipid II flippase
VEPTTPQPERQIVRAASVVMLGLAVSSLAGLLTTMLVSRSFGTGPVIDAFYAANRLTEILFNLMAGGALASAFVPTFTGLLTRGDRPGAWRLASSVANLVVLLLFLAALLAWAAGPWIVQNVLAPGFADPAQIQLTVDLLRILLLSPIVFGASGLLMGILNAHQHFALPALAPACYRLGWIAGLHFLVPIAGIHGLAWGVVLGSVLHLLIQLPGLRGLGSHYTFELGLSLPSVRQVARLMAPRLFGVAVVQLNFLVNTLLASSMAPGSLTALTFSFTLMYMPETVLAQALAIAALPTLSAQVARGDLGGMRHSLVGALRGMLFLSLPASLGLIVLRKPIVAMLLQGGEFGAQSVDLVSWSLLWYAAGLAGHSLLEIVARAFYALEDTRTPVAVGAAAMGLNILLSLTLAAVFGNQGWPPHGGLALANSLATGVECCVLIWIMRRRLGGLETARLARGLLVSAVAAAGMVAGLITWLQVTAGQSALLIGAGGVIVGGAVYWLIGLVLGAPEARRLPTLLLRRFV